MYRMYITSGKKNVETTLTAEQLLVSHNNFFRQYESYILTGEFEIHLRLKNFNMSVKLENNKHV